MVRVWSYLTSYIIIKTPTHSHTHTAELRIIFSIDYLLCPEAASINPAIIIHKSFTNTAKAL